MVGRGTGVPGDEGPAFLHRSPARAQAWAASSASFPAGLRCGPHGGRRTAGAGAGAGARRRGAAPAFFYFDLACPFSYLAAERVERLFARVVWRPVLGEGIHRGDPEADPLRATAARGAAERGAGELRVPLVWSELGSAAPTASLPAMRVASFAAENGRTAAFALAAGRLKWC